jgi:glycosyltransferase involved in cell wall biosynthesis
VGDGELRVNVEQSTREKNIEKYVHFLGWRLDVENIYSGLDVLILTSLNEGTPFTIIEAMASQVPVVATRVGGVPDLITDHVTGLLCPSNDFQAMAECAKQLFESGELRQKLVKNACKFAEANYSYERLIKEMEKLYSEL